MFKNIFKKHYILDIIIIFILSLVPLLWFKGNTIMVGHDLVFPLDPVVFLTGRLSTWISHNFGQSQTLIMGTIPIHLIDIIPSLLGFSLQVTEKIVYVFWFFAMGISAYILASALNNKSRIFKFIALILYQFNSFILQGWFIGERTKFSAYIAFPLILTVFIKVYRKEINIFKGTIYNTLILFIFNGGGLFGIPLFGGYFVGLVTFILFFSLLSFLRKKYDLVKRLFLLVFLSSLGYFLVNAYYILPALLQISAQYVNGLDVKGGVGGLIAWASEISASASFANLFRLQGIPEWYDNVFHPYSQFYIHNLWLILISFIWPVLALLTVYIYKKREKVEIILYFFMLYIMGIIFTAGTHPPLGFIYSFLMNHVPGFIIFRSPYYKFAPALFLANSFLVAYFFDYLKGKKRLIFTSLFIIVILFYNFPYFAGNFFEWRKGYSTRVSIPAYVFEFGKWINNEKLDDLRVLVLPPNDPAFQYNAYTWGYLSFQSLPTLISNKSVIINNDQLNNEEQTLLMVLYRAIEDNDQELTNKLLSILRIHYIVLEKDKIINSGTSVSSDVRMYEKFASSNGILLKSFGEWSVYEMSKFPLPPIYLSNSTNILHGSINDVKNYFSQSDSTSFVLKSDVINIVQRNNPTPSSFYVPECLNCPDSKSKPVIQIPNANILPDSPLYPLVLFKEQRNLGKAQGTSRVYDDLGLSLKRLSEVKAIGIRDGKISDIVLKQYDDLLRKTFSDFTALTKIEDKMKVADDINYYMKAEQGYLFQALDAYVTTGHAVTIDFSKAYVSINDLLTSINSFIYKPDLANNRLYKISVDKSNEFEILLKKDELISFLKDGSKLKIGIDDKHFREIKLNANNFNDTWFSFGKVALAEGIHYMSLSFPEPSNLNSPLNIAPINFNFYSETNCYAAKVNGYSNRKLYRVKINYINDFASDLVFYIWEQKNNKNKLINLAKLKTNLIGNEYVHYVQSSGDSSNLWVGICSNGLNADLISRKINIISQEVVSPALLVKPTIQSEIWIKNIKFTKISLTEYRISFENNDNYAILNFMERFDVGWILQEFSRNHYRGEGYENSWLIDKQGKFNLLLKYHPQRTFSVGSFISLFSVITLIGYLIYLRYKEKHD